MWKNNIKFESETYLGLGFAVGYVREMRQTFVVLPFIVMFWTVVEDDK